MPMTGASAFDAAPQHGPRPLPLFLQHVREQTAASPEREAKAMAGLRRYQAADRGLPRDAMPEAARTGRACLRDYGGGGPPLVVVPSLINPPFVLDLAAHNSLMRWLATRGVRPLLVDWGTPRPDERGRDVAAHVEELLLPLIDALGERPLLAGYCLGGTMALAAAAIRPPRALALIAAPWRFSGFPDAARAEIAALWAEAEPMCRTLGLVPMEVLQSGFWKLDPARTVAKYEAFADLPEDSAEAAAFVALEDWANAGAPLTYAAGAEMFRLFAEDATGRGAWRVGDAAVDPHALSCPVADFVSLTDRIVPAASATGLPGRRELTSGHVGMIVGSRARAQLWEPLADFLCAAATPR
ncbi:alpha/beta hydrolase [Sphingomonas gilva]|uniref:Alpha/beta hydrolase n=1 Tax=Sphingomonas gilva TaxID=2305907 RepID=A0A396RLY4_9SPHN|nr:alpha/beta hydrolase [Sphingomonas gilva]RHW16626.1 alpha/beta hydrolase [Sphingomonas gilva]